MQQDNRLFREYVLSMSVKDFQTYSVHISKGLKNSNRDQRNAWKDWIVSAAFCKAMRYYWVPWLRQICVTNTADEYSIIIKIRFQPADLFVSWYFFNTIHWSWTISVSHPTKIYLAHTACVSSIQNVFGSSDPHFHQSNSSSQTFMFQAFLSALIALLWSS